MTEHWLRLANLQISPRIAQALLDVFGDPETLFASDLADLTGIAGVPADVIGKVRDPHYQASAAQVAYMGQPGVTVVARDDADYPPALREIADPPPMLFVRGRLQERDRFAVGVVGTRQPTPYGRAVTGRLCRDLADHGLTVISGGAVGVDATAHRSALESGGRTVAVLGCGLDIRYPRENLPLFDEIVATGRGALVSEYPPGTKPDGWRFPQRNRLISGMSKGILVVEAGERSGALLTAGYAADQGREVMAVPGNIDREASRGTNGLIRDGAALVTCAADVARALGMLVLEPPKGPREVREDQALPEMQRRILAMMSLTPIHIDAIAAGLQAGIPEVAVDLTMLELGGLVRRLPGNTYIRVL